MVRSSNLLAVLLLPTIALGAPQRGHQRLHGIQRLHGVQRRALVTHTTWTVVQMTSTVTVDVSATDVAAPVPEAEVKANPQPAPIVEAPAPVAVVEPSAVVAPEPTILAAPDVAPPAQTPSPTPEAKAEVEAAPEQAPSTPAAASAGQVLFKNACSYDVAIDLIKTTCGASETDLPPVKAGSTWTAPLTACEAANPTLKVYRLDGEGNRTTTKPMQFEYGYRPSQSMAWYNLSPKDCVSDIFGAGLEDCAGGPWSIDSTSTAPLAQHAEQCRTYECSDATTCCTENAYCDDIATAARAIGNLEPVSGCPGALSEIAIVMQIC